VIGELPELRRSGASDFDLSLVEAGQHKMHLFARYNLANELTKIAHANIIIEQDMLSNWRSGKTQASEYRHRDIEIKKLPRS
jgi:hypothetical protein